LALNFKRRENKNVRIKNPQINSIPKPKSLGKYTKVSTSKKQIRSFYYIAARKISEISSALTRIGLVNPQASFNAFSVVLGMSSALAPSYSISEEIHSSADNLTIVSITTLSTSSALDMVTSTPDAFAISF